MFLADLSDAVSRKPWRFAAVVASLGLVVLIMLALSWRIEQQSGYGIFDIPGSTSTEQDLRAALTSYDSRSVVMLWLFYALDFIFPFLSSLIAASLAAWGLRNAWPERYERESLKIWLPVFFVGAVFDWFENIAFLVTLSAYPPPRDSLIAAYFFLHNAKLWVGPIGVLALVAFCWGLIRRYATRLREAGSG